MFFEVQCDDLERAIKFYRSVFGWEFHRQETAPIQYYDVTTSGIRGGFLERPAAAPAVPSGTNAAVISMEVKNFDEAAAKILELGGQVALPKFAVPGRCWQGYFLDLEENTFGIFEVDSKAK
jgi:predicted enzyme related to lactoylglutathione lyase